MGTQMGMRTGMEEVFDTTHYDWTQCATHLVNEQILNIHRKLLPDVVFIQTQRGGIIDPRTAKLMRGTSFVANWTGDVRDPVPDFYIELAPYVSVTLFTDMVEVEFMRKLGLKADFLHLGFNSEVYTNKGIVIDSKDIVFMGTHYPKNPYPLSEFRKEMVGRLMQTFGSDFAVYGFGWEMFKSGVMYLKDFEEAMVYRSCKIAINANHFSYPRYANSRTLKAMGSGAFCLAHQYPDMNKDFKVGKHLDSWQTIDELIEKINYYLENDKARNKIAKSGCEWVRANHTWVSRMKLLKEMAGLK